MSQDIREWARANGHPDLGDKGRLPAGVAEEYRQAHTEPYEPDDEPFEITPSAAPSEPQDAAEEPPPPVARVEERKPQAPRKDRLGALKRKTKPEPGRRAFPRVSAASLLGFAYSGIGYLAARDQRGVPVARSMDLMAPVAGEVLDDVIKGTFVDHLLQPVVRNSDKAEKIAALTGFPLLVSLVTARPELYPVVRSAMRMSIVLALEVSEQPMKKLQRKAEQFEEKFGAIDIDGMIDAVFADLDMPVKHSADEDAAVRRAQGD